jgi:outer membrane protein assembly factor BamB
MQAGTSADSSVTDSVAGGALTAVPGGVWISFRTGMMGETILLGQSDLAMVGPPSSDLGESQPDGVFGWIMGASTIYGDGAVFVVNQNGVMACVDPDSGQIRAQEHLADAEGTDIQLLAVDATTGVVFATDGEGLDAITPPAACRG